MGSKAPRIRQDQVERSHPILYYYYYYMNDYFFFVFFFKKYNRTPYSIFKQQLVNKMPKNPRTCLGLNAFLRPNTAVTKMMAWLWTVLGRGKKIVSVGLSKVSRKFMTRLRLLICSLKISLKCHNTSSSSYTGACTADSPQSKINNR